MNGDIAAWTEAAKEELQNPNKEYSENVAKVIPVEDFSKKSILTSLANVASPYPVVDATGKMNAVPNPRLDVPDIDIEYMQLPEQQQLIGGAVLDALPENSPPIVKSSIGFYCSHLNERGAQPIVGALQQLFGAFKAAYQQEEGELWGKGLETLLDNFSSNHVLLMKHFPLSEEREKIYAKFVLNEKNATYSAIVTPVEEVRDALAHFPQFPTDDLIKILDATVRNAKEIATLSGTGSAAPKKRFVLSFLGLTERFYSIVGTTVALASTPQAIALSSVLLRSLDKYLALIQFAN